MGGMKFRLAPGCQLNRTSYDASEAYQQQAQRPRLEHLQHEVLHKVPQKVLPEVQQPQHQHIV